MKKLLPIFALAILASSAHAIDDLPTRILTRARGVVIAIHGNALTITDSEYKNEQREIVIGSAAVITVLSDDQSTYLPGDIEDITPGQTVTVGLAIDAVTAGTVQIMGEYASGIIRQVDPDKIIISEGGKNASAKTRVVPLFDKTEFRMPAESEAGKKTVRTAQFKELETGQTVSIHMSTADRTKAKLITVTRLAKQPNPSPSPRVSARPASPSTN